MSSEYVPTDEDVYGVWINHQCFYSDDGHGPRGIGQATAEMDRYIAALTSAAKRDALAELAAWHRENAEDPETPTPIRRGIAVMADEAQRFKDSRFPAK